MSYMDIAHFRTRYPHLVTDTIRSMPCDRASYIVTIDGKPYAGFVTREYAEMAVALWTGEIDGAGVAIPANARPHRGWPAVRGRPLEVIERR
jgi:hypothetical protein